MSGTDPENKPSFVTKKEEMIGQALEAGAYLAGLIETKEVVTDASFRDICASNGCGVYGKCWMCPPDIGEINELMPVIRTYSYVLVYQNVYPLEDSFDIEGMQAAKKDFVKLTQRMRKAFPDPSMLHLGTGGCGLCTPCAKRENKPCRFPDLAVSSLEGYGINVSKLAASEIVWFGRAKMWYNGKNVRATAVI